MMMAELISVAPSAILNKAPLIPQRSPPPPPPGCRASFQADWGCPPSAETQFAVTALDDTHGIVACSDLRTMTDMDLADRAVFCSYGIMYSTKYNCKELDEAACTTMAIPPAGAYEKVRESMYRVYHCPAGYGFDNGEPWFLIECKKGQWVNDSYKPYCVASIVHIVHSVDAITTAAAANASATTAAMWQHSRGEMRTTTTPPEGAMGGAATTTAAAAISGAATTTAAAATPKAATTTAAAATPGAATTTAAAVPPGATAAATTSPRGNATTTGSFVNHAPKNTTPEAVTTTAAATTTTPGIATTTKAAATTTTAPQTTIKTTTSVRTTAAQTQTTTPAGTTGGPSTAMNRTTVDYNDGDNHGHHTNSGNGADGRFHTVGDRGRRRLLLQWLLCPREWNR
ncbi:hypothetical protein C7M84_002781 [Penaeus vannamei]|uniref:Sushi domain-containing protein n=1 Tax=Penaeus vannamei TaxID=6689 RepID=A0A423TPW6_PENVA|nr:hypothetical protein C7M84_002781 [Penaeus vannamei]